MPKQKISITKKDILEEKKDKDIWWQDSKKGGKKTITIISVLVFIIIAIGLASVLFDQKNKLNQKETEQLRSEIELSKKSTQDELDTLQSQLSDLQKKLDDAEKAKQAQTAEKSAIEGSLSFPSSYIPEDMQICALDTTNDQNLFCTKDHVVDKKYTYGIGYKIELSAGTYNVYATVSTWQGYKAYYSEFVTCGLKASCPSHNPIEVKVEAEKTTSKIDPIDWYKQ